MPDTRINEVLAAESARCAAIRTQDFESLAALLHPSLVHVHTRGNQDTRESYLKYLKEVIEILDITRGELKVFIHGDSAVMTGRQYNKARIRGAEPIVTVEAQVMQLWIAESGMWRQVALQATPIGAPPPPIPSVGRPK
jgi:ketosteroid isomerase-like protein